MVWWIMLKWIRNHEKNMFTIYCIEQINKFSDFKVVGWSPRRPVETWPSTLRQEPAIGPPMLIAAAIIQLTIQVIVICHTKEKRWQREGFFNCHWNLFLCPFYIWGQTISLFIFIPHHQWFFITFIYKK